MGSVKELRRDVTKGELRRGAIGFFKQNGKMYEKYWLYR